VLFRPKPSVSEAERQAMFAALSAASTGIPTVRRFHIGNRITHGRPYEHLMKQSYPYAAVIEFDDLDGLKAYLNHPQHEKLGALFYELLDAGLVYDYEMNAPVLHSPHE
jgi:stress responsive alpha/beta barrel protein